MAPAHKLAEGSYCQHQGLEITPPPPGVLVCVQLSGSHCRSDICLTYASSVLGGADEKTGTLFGCTPRRRLYTAAGHSG